MLTDYLFSHLQEMQKEIIEILFHNIMYQNAEIKDFNVWIDGKSFFDLPIKNKKEVYDKIIDISRNNDYTTGNLLDFAYFKENYQFIAINLNKQTNLKIHNKLISLENLKTKQMEQHCFLLSKNSKKQPLNFGKIL